MRGFLGGTVARRRRTSPGHAWILGVRRGALQRLARRRVPGTLQGLARSVRSPARPALFKLLERTPYKAAPKGESRNRVGVAQGHESGRRALLQACDPQATDDRPTARSRDKPQAAPCGVGKGLPLRSLLLPLALPWVWASPLHLVFLAVVESTDSTPWRC